MIKTAYLEIRRQHSRGSSSNMFGGPDTYVSVQIVPKGIVKLKCLNISVAQKRGITIKYFGEGYSKHRGPSSSLGKAIRQAKEYIKKINKEGKV